MSRSGSDHCNPSLEFSPLPEKGSKLLFLYVFRACHVYNIPTCPLKAIRITARWTTNPRDQLKRHSIQTFKEFNFNYFTVNLLSIFISNSIKSHPHKRGRFKRFRSEVFIAALLFAYLGIRTANVVGIKHYCNFHYYFYESVFFLFLSSLSINIIIVYSILHSSRHILCYYIRNLLQISTYILYCTP